MSIKRTVNLPVCPVTGWARTAQYNFNYNQDTESVEIPLTVRYYKDGALVPALTSRVVLVGSDTLVNPSNGNKLSDAQVYLFLNYERLVSEYEAKVLTYNDDMERYQQALLIYEESLNTDHAIPAPAVPVEPTPVGDKPNAMKEYDFYDKVIGSGLVDFHAMIHNVILARVSEPGNKIDELITVKPE